MYVNSNLIHSYEYSYVCRFFIHSCMHIIYNECLQISPSLLCSNFHLLCFEHCSRKLPIMQNIMLITTAIMPQFIYNLYLIVLMSTLAQFGFNLLCCRCCSAIIQLFTIMLKQKPVPYFVPNLNWHYYYFSKVLIKIVI